MPPACNVAVSTVDMGQKPHEDADRAVGIAAGVRHQAVAHLAHDDRDRGLERLRYGRENLRADLFLTALHLTEIAERNARLARDLAKGAALLQTEVTENVTYFLSYQNHWTLLFCLLNPASFPVGGLRLQPLDYENSNH